MAVTHRQTKTREYGIWQTMLTRCRNPKRKDYPAYGGRGITVCDRWLSFENFIADMGRRPTPEHTLERKDNSAGYAPGNCEWVSRAAQNRNQRRRRDNKSGFTGVYWKARLRKWVAYIGHQGRAIHIGVFDDPAVAAEARRQKAAELGFNPNHGRAA